MTKNEFLQKLKWHMGSIPSTERQDIVRDFEEHFQMAHDKGESEHQVAKDLGDPKKLAESLKADYFIDQAKEHSSWVHLQKAIATSVGIGFLNFIFILPLLIIIIAVIGSFIFSGLVTLGVSFVPFLRVPFLEALFNTFLVFGVGLFLLISGIYLIKPFYYLLLRYLSWNVKLIKEGRASR